MSTLDLFDESDLFALYQELTWEVEEAGVLFVTPKKADYHYVRNTPALYLTRPQDAKMAPSLEDTDPELDARAKHYARVFNFYQRYAEAAYWMMRVQRTGDVLDLKRTISVLGTAYTEYELAVQRESAELGTDRVSGQLLIYTFRRTLEHLKQILQRMENGGGENMTDHEVRVALVCLVEPMSG